MYIIYILYYIILYYIILYYIILYYIILYYIILYYIIFPVTIRFINYHGQGSLSCCLAERGAKTYPFGNWWKQNPLVCDFGKKINCRVWLPQGVAACRFQHASCFNSYLSSSLWVDDPPELENLLGPTAGRKSGHCEQHLDRVIGLPTGFRTTGNHKMTPWLIHRTILPRFRASSSMRIESTWLLWVPNF